MSYEEFKNEFINAQKNINAPYRMFVFDIKNSKNMNDEIRFDAQIKSVKTLIFLAKALQEIEIKTGKKILFQDERVKLNLDFSIPNPNIANPCVNIGDSFVISIFNGSCSDKKIIETFLKSLKKFDNQYTYNLTIGNFETTDYGLAATKCYIGYCMSELCFNKKLKRLVISEQQYLGDFEK